MLLKSKEFYFKDFGKLSKKEQESRGLLEADGKVGTSSERQGLSQDSAGTQGQCHLGLL